MKKDLVIVNIAVVIIIVGSLIIYDLNKQEPIPIEPIEPDPIPDPDPEPEPTPANLTIIEKGVVLTEQGHRFFLEIKVKNTGDLSAYNTTITANVNFTKHGGASINLKNDMGRLRNGTVRGSLVVPVIHYGISEHTISLEFLLGSMWTERPISFIANSLDGYSFHIVSDNIVIE